ncbi:CTP:molybdopterin cytidylyltransferase [Halalkalibacter wakoensis JCM 9140]|uniref:CTP:molybdopterin cytidylyltransferase n=1 Tax=Halalkalibacter wakoensis JCM 9140 TaxID=1236970 RepID=W4Q301_9BACI|nr:nucleotidyltransferase family protein [Halalkalibacter wakoensis]GAE26098.1 CTP:molybdopterin cytidylyltransferase [Halalkalibacter wakoensis JCM 9140]
MVEKNGCAVILAAGTSSRMGEAKQLLQIGERPLLQHVIDNVSHHPFQSILVVLGHEAHAIEKELHYDSDRVTILYNSNYQEGQSTSFLTAVHSISSKVKHAVFFLGDQPFICAETVNAMIDLGYRKAGESADPFVIRPMFDQKPGHPVFWGNVKEMDFSSLTGDSGGKNIMESVRREFVHVNDENILFDIDTREDYERALEKVVET